MGVKICCIDFETANPLPGSACSVGIARIEDGVVVETSERLILPHARCRWFNPTYIDIHGIRPADVREAPEFDELAPWLFSQLRADLVIAHNAVFDMGVLRAACDRYGLEGPEFEYLCTCKLARRFWRRLPNHRLGTLAEHIGFAFHHHRAGEDAEAAGRILLAMMREAGLDLPGALAGGLGISTGYFARSGERACLCVKPPVIFGESG